MSALSTNSESDRAAHAAASPAGSHWIGQPAGGGIHSGNGELSALLGRLMGALWALGLLVLGIRLLVDGPGLVAAVELAFPAGGGSGMGGRAAIEAVERAFALLGAASVCGGLFVFMVLCADRAFPQADRRLVLATEAGMVLLVIAATASAVWFFRIGVIA
jgi:hypothetical protein